MHDRETADTIDDAASDWAARLDRGLNDSERQALETWLAADSRRVGALARARALWCRAEQALADAPLAHSTPRRFAPSRRQAIGGGLAAAAAVAAAIVVGPRMIGGAQLLQSGVGEVRRIALEDGSAVTLGPETQLRYSFDTAQRLIELVSGNAFFEVAHDSQRPFVVVARWLTLRAVDTAFGVRTVAGLPLSVLVARGRIDVLGAGGGALARLTSNMRLDTARAGEAKAVMLEPDALQRALAWREGMLSFEGDTLASVAAQFNNYGPVRIDIADRALAREPITGLFAANDPRGFAHAIAASLDARVEDTGEVVRLRRRGPAK